MLLFCDSFNNYNTPSQKWSQVSGNESIVSTGGIGARTGTQWYSLSDFNGSIINFAARSQFIAGDAFCPYNFGGDGNARCYRWVTAGGNYSITIVVKSDLSIHVFRQGPGSTDVDIGSTPAGICTQRGWNYIETSIKIDPSAGFVTIRLNGVQVLSLANINTEGGAGLAYATGFQLMGAGGSGGGGSQHSDTYLLDSTVSPNTTFLGPVQIYGAKQVPFEDSATVQWSPLVPGAHYPMVDSVPPNLSDYVYSNTGQVDEYLHAITGIPPTVAVLAVQHCLLAEIDAAGSRSIGSSVNEITGSNSAALTTTPHYVLQPYDTDPVTGQAWLLANIPLRRIGPVVTV
jgi:hypothetical protein